jgi:hypothetical protein
MHRRTETCSAPPQLIYCKTETCSTSRADLVAAAEEEHEYFKNEKMAMAYERGQLHSAMWRTFQQVSRAADLVFMNDPIKRALFNVG